MSSRKYNPVIASIPSERIRDADYLDTTESLFSLLGESFKVDLDDTVERTEIWKENLRDLGYLNVFGESPDQDDAPLREAVKCFRKECDESLADGVVEVCDPASMAGETQTHPEAGEFSFLASLLSFDGNLRFRRPPELGERNLVTRVVHYRLRCLGFYHHSAGEPFDERSLAALERFLRSLAFHRIMDPETGRAEAGYNRSSTVYRLFIEGKTVEDVARSTEIFDLLGDAREITDLYLDEFTHRPLFFRDREYGAGVEAKSDELFVFAGRFMEISIHGSRRRVGEERYQAALKERSERGSLEQCLAEEQNRLGLALLLIRLSMFGYYQGNFGGSMTVDYRKILSIVSEAEDLDKITMRVEMGCGAVNLNRLHAHFNSLSGGNDGVDPGTVSMESMERELEKLMKPQSGGRSGYEIIQENLPRREEEGAATRSRYFTAVSSFLRWVWQCLARGFRWLLKLADRAVRAIQQLFQFISDNLREGVRILRRSLIAFADYAKGLPILTRDKEKSDAVVATWFRHDADVDTIVTKNAGEDTVREHRERCEAHVRNLTLFLAVAGTFVKFLLLAASGGSSVSVVRIAMLILSLFRRIVQTPERGPLSSDDTEHMYQTI